MKSMKPMVKDLATTLEDIVNKINGVTSNQSTEKEDEISRIDDDISNQSTKKKEKEGLPKSEDEIDILEKYWTSEKSEKKEYLTKLENKIKRISDILNQSTRGKINVKLNNWVVDDGGNINRYWYLDVKFQLACILLKIVLAKTVIFSVLL
ncbi:7821_t:CDS:2 [Entrophospora sp. SA101]|nr:7821_t:CDS:2 [Entrophospora sp. SA101]